MRFIKAILSIFAVSALYVQAAQLAQANSIPQQQNLLARKDMATLDTTSVITVGDIQKINREVEAIIDQRDVEGVLEYMAPFIISESITESSNASESVYIEGIEQHREMLTSVFNEAESDENLNTQEISRKESIRVTPDGQLATAVISTVSEVTTDDELRLITTTDTIRFARLQGEVKVIFYTTDSQITSHDRQD